MDLRVSNLLPLAIVYRIEYNERKRKTIVSQDFPIDLLGNWISAGLRRIFCSVQRDVTAGILYVFQGSGSKHRAK